VKPLGLVVHISDRTLRLEGVSEVPLKKGLQLTPFSIPALAARQLQARYPLSALARLLEPSRFIWCWWASMLTPRSWFLQLARDRTASGPEPCLVTIFTENSAQLEATLVRRYPALRSLLGSLEIHQLSSGADFIEDDLVRVEGPSRERRVTTIVVSAGSDTEAIVRARRLRAVKTSHGRWLAPISCPAGAAGDGGAIGQHLRQHQAVVPGHPALR
jgi:hypothetical protein